MLGPPCNSPPPCSLICSQHDMTIGVQSAVCELDLEHVIIWLNVLFWVFFGVVDLKILAGERKELRGMYSVMQYARKNVF